MGGRFYSPSNRVLHSCGNLWLKSNDALSSLPSAEILPYSSWTIFIRYFGSLPMPCSVPLGHSTLSMETCFERIGVRSCYSTPYVGASSLCSASQVGVFLGVWKPGANLVCSRPTCKGFKSNPFSYRNKQRMCSHHELQS